ncbi:MAG: helix-turn-helix transcriptional regulator [Lachnospiraceae bacterium]|jgi:transcriptional regulator with XRE-family HTH domain|nr:helix-turn-helix transcriptional regulator [uncultured Acetatifactor sp.]MCI9574064.1 helix-turn-helix transcriptional regulator [Lachnospiraceae bacterium]
MGNISEQEFILEYNKTYGQMIRQERRKRKLSLEDLSSGILSRTALEKVEKGEAQWTKLTGDTLMLRMGISPEYFESLTSGESLERWRMREDICLLVYDNPEQAVTKLKEYRKIYSKREPLEEQFLMKTEVILLLHATARVTETRHQGRMARTWGYTGAKAAVILEKARQMAGCTVQKGWERHLEELCLSPGELEAVLLYSVALFLNNREDEAWELWKTVWGYPQAHGWGGRIMALILPQAAILGIRLAYASGRFSDSLAFRGISEGDMAAGGRKALELLRRYGCHCYVLPLLDALCGLDAALFGRPEYPEQVRKFREMFREIYGWFDYPGYRIWQGISIDNTRDAGTVLKMLRTFYGKSRESAVYDGGEQVVTPRHLEKIEKGTHKPSYENYSRLAKQYGKYGGWHMPLLETDSTDVLALRQRISTLLEYSDWEGAEREIRRFREMVDETYPKVRQELRFFEAAMKWKKEGALRESLEMMLEALHCTVPEFEGRDMKWWVYQREEIMIAGDIGNLYRRLGNFSEAKKWYEAVLFSIRQNCVKTDIYNYGYNVVIQGYSNYLGDIHAFEEAAELSEAAAHKDLLYCRINCSRHLFYHMAWNAYEIAAEKPERHKSLRPKWRKAFRISETMADFVYDSHMRALLEERKAKFLS